MESSHSCGGGGRGRGSGGVGASTCSVPPVPRSRVVEGCSAGCSTSLPRRTFKRPPRAGKGVQLQGLCWQLLEFQAGLVQEHPPALPWGCTGKESEAEGFGRCGAAMALWLVFSPGGFWGRPAFTNPTLCWWGHPLVSLACFFFWLGVDTVFLLPKTNQPWICKQKLQ